MNRLANRDGRIAALMGGKIMNKLKNETIYLIKKIYEKYPTGGALHIVIDDGNTEDYNIYWCIENSIRELTEDKDLFERCATCLMKLGTERRRDNAIYEAFNACEWS